MTAPPPQGPGHGPRPAPSRPAPRPGAPQQQPAAAPARGAPLPPGPSADAACAGPQPAPGRPAFPGADPLAPTFEDEIRTALSYEKGLAGKALVAIAIVALVLAVRFLFLG
jgi:hypothetical protein